MSHKSNLIIAGGLVVFGTVMASVPYMFRLIHSEGGKAKNLQNSEKPLSPSQMQRGLFIQAGQKDVGPDPNWVGGVYQYGNKSKKGSQVKETQPTDK